MKKAKIEMETLGKLLLLTAFLIIFLLMFKGCKDQMENVGMVGTNEYVCWFSHTLKGQITFLFPSACYPIDVEKEQDKKGISILMRKCWWMHGQGEEDLVTGETNLGVIAKKGISWYDIARTCYIFTPKEDTSIQDFLTYLRNYDKSGKELEKKEEDSKKTTWGYIQKVESTGTEAGAETGICFDKETAGDTLSKGKMYYIIFYDDRGPFSNGARDKIMISRKPEFGEDQTGFLSWFSNLIKTIVKLGSLDYHRYCYDWAGEAQKKVEEESERLAEEQKGDAAVKLFESLVTNLKECSKVTGQNSCYCGSKLEGWPSGSAVEFKKIEDKKYKVSLLVNNKLYEKEGVKSVEEIKGNIIGSWRERSPSKGACGIIGQGSMRNVYVEGNIDETYTVYHPNTGGDCKSSSGVYFVSESDKIRSLSSIKECSEITADLNKEETLNLEEDKKASDVFDKIFAKFESCSKIIITESCMCDDSATSSEDISLDYNIKIEKKSKEEYTFKLYHDKRGILKEKTLNMKIGLIGSAENDIKTTARGPSSTVTPKTLCTEGLGLVNLFSISKTPFSLVYNIDSRFYLQAFSEDISLCTDIQKDDLGAYKGLYIFFHTYNTSKMMWYSDTAKFPVLKYCSGKPVSVEAAEEIEKRLCENYIEADCNKHLDKCYPYTAMTQFTSCKYCGTEFQCGQILSEKACNLDPCLKNCKWQSTPPIGGVCLDE